VVDEDNDRILTSLDLLLQDKELLGDLWDDGLEDFPANPLQLLYKYLDYVVLCARKAQANSDRNDAPIRCRLEWINVILAAMDLPKYSEFHEGWKTE
jgi:hypothetical protein